MSVIGEKRPGVGGEPRRLDERSQPAHEVRAVGAVPEDRRLLDAPHHHVVEGAEGVEARLTGHGGRSLAQGAIGCPVPLYVFVPSRLTTNPQSCQASDAVGVRDLPGSSSRGSGADHRRYSIGMLGPVRIGDGDLALT